ncbi:LacI family DNA-binding transcriptional regulator [Microbacterium foliorum]|uniref:LacI family DNA-binding transcriptional regulator n=1 Tax=Microbacterium foliorum TaxID=104336 RepID=UPI001D5398E4|nr:LacI family DNA-binding transcriptional regulator [Microbacterium foliorum]CAH0156994.1 Catabolite control protein A [Microbacterium foliorum]CAH0172984.1 Catabolite control protein A [Microbacterium foliorum]
MSRKATVYDVAERAGVSIATVSRVLRQPDAVRPATRERVLDTVSELGYVPSGSARGLAERRTGVLGLYFPGFDASEDAPALDVLAEGQPTRPSFTVEQRTADAGVPQPTMLFLDEVLRGAELEAWKQGFVLMIGVGRDDPGRETVRDIAGRVDGLMVLARSVPDDVLARLARRIPVVVLSGPARGDSYDHVTVDNAEAMAELTRLVFAQADPGGIAYLGGPADSPDGAQRWDGFAAAVAEAGLALDDVTVLRGDFTRASGHAAAQTLIVGGAPAVLVAANDQMALGAIDAFRSAGIRVPEDVRVTGFDGIEAAALSRPALTTVRQPMIDLGRAAVQLLSRRLEQPDAEPMTVRLPLQIIVRESSQRP